MAKLPTSDSRARRFRLRLPLEYRGRPTEEWRSGSTENISVSGALFRAAELLQPRTPIEFSLLLPPRLSGPVPLRLFGRGTVVRIAHAPFGPGQADVATSFVQLMLSPSANGRDPAPSAPLSHRLFSNLAVVLGNSELLLDRKDLPPEVRVRLARLHSAVLALAGNVRELAS